MAIPDYKTLMLPLLKIAGDEQEHQISGVRDQLARAFRLTEKERQQLRPSGRKTLFADRVHWARTYLCKADLLEVTKRAHFRITDRGRKVLAEGPSHIDNKYLLQFAKFSAWIESGRLKKPLASMGKRKSKN